MPPAQFAESIRPYLDKTLTRRDYDLAVLAKVLQPRTEQLTDVIDQVDFIDSLPEYDNAMYCHKKMKTTEESALQALRMVLPVLEALPEWTESAIHDALMGLAAEQGSRTAGCCGRCARQCPASRYPPAAAWSFAPFWAGRTPLPGSGRASKSWGAKEAP